MKKEYDFSNAEQGKFYRPAGQLKIPVYLDPEVENFFAKKALIKKTELDKMINSILRKEMDLIKKIA